MHKTASLIFTATIMCFQAVANPYHEKIRHNNMRGLKELCRQQLPGINDKARFGESPLHMAVVYNKPEMVTLLLSAGASILSTNNLKQTPLHTAAVLGFSRILSHLLQNLYLEEDDEDRTAILDWQDLGGSTALHLAAQAGHSVCIRKLIDAGADVFIKNNRGQQALAIAEHLFDSYHGGDLKTKVRLSSAQRLLRKKTVKRTALIGNPFALLAELGDFL